MYRSIPSFSDYLLIRQNKVFVEHYYKHPNGWQCQDFDRLEQLIPLEHLAIELRLAKIYRNIKFRTVNLGIRKHIKTITRSNYYIQLRFVNLCSIPI